MHVTHACIVPGVRWCLDQSREMIKLISLQTLVDCSKSGGLILVLPYHHYDSTIINYLLSRTDVLSCP